MTQRTRIEWVKNPDRTQGYTWNPITGCLHGCPYCYARRLASRFAPKEFPNVSKIMFNEKYQANLLINSGYGRNKALPFPGGFLPTFYPERLADPGKVKKSATIFVCSMADLFGEWVPFEWIQDVLFSCRQAQRHNYIFLTKNPLRYKEIDATDERYWPLSAWKGATNTGNNDLTVLPDFISFEPLLTAPNGFMLNIVIPRLKWVIVGAQTGPGAIRPKKEWVQEIVRACRDNNIPLFLKDNLLKIYPDLPNIQEVPWAGTLIYERKNFNGH